MIAKNELNRYILNLCRTKQTSVMENDDKKGTKPEEKKGKRGTQG